MGRAKKVTGPFLDNMGIDMLQGGGKLFLGSGGRYVGPGHFGLLDLGDGVQKFSCHYEADLDRGGISVLDIRPLLWRDGWPVAGENVKAGTYAIESARTGTALELAVQGVPVGGLRGRGGRGAPGAGGPPGGGRGGAPDAAGRGGAANAPAAPAPPPAPIPPQEASQVSANWPAGPACAHVSLHAPGAAEVGDRAGRECGRLPRIAVLQDHDRRNGSHARRDGGSRADRPAGIHRRAGATVAHRSARRRHLPPDAEGGPEFEGPAGAVRRRQQHADAREIQPGQRSSALEHEDAMTVRMNRSCRGIVPLLLIAALWPAASAFSRLPADRQEGKAAARPPASSLTRPVSPAKPTGADGFIQRWLLLEPIRVPGQLTESAVRTAVEKDFPVTATPLPHDGDTLKVGDSELTWHAVDTVNYNVNLYHFAYALNKPTTNVLFWAVTVVNAPREMSGVRLAIGSNAASVWWVNGTEATALYNDRQAVIDDGVSKRLTLNAGRERDSRRDRQRGRGDRFLRAVSRRERSADQDADRDADRAVI